MGAVGASPEDRPELDVGCARQHVAEAVEGRNASPGLEYPGRWRVNAQLERDH